MSTAAPSSHDEYIWSRSEINAWLESLPRATQEKMKELGRKWVQEGKDILLGFNIVRYIIEKGYMDVYGNVAQSAPQNSFLGFPLKSKAPGIFGAAQDILLARREARVERNLADMGDHFRRVEAHNDRMYKLSKMQSGISHNIAGDHIR